MRLNRIVRYWLPPILWMIFFFPVLNRFLGSPALYRALLSLVGVFFQDVSASSIEVPYIIIRKTIHFIEFSVLTYLLFRAFRGGSNKKWETRWAVYAGVISIGYGFLDEFLQTFIPTRNGSVLDGVVDSVGVLFVLGIVRRQSKKQDFNEK